MNQITIRPARPDDAAGIALVQRDSWLDTYPNDDAGISREAIEAQISNFQSPERINRWRDIIAGEEHVTVALNANKVVGFSCGKREGDVNRMAAIYVLSQYWGTGIAQQLMQSTMNWLGNERDILVEVVTYNVRAIRFYEKYGFMTTGEAGHHDLLPTIFMRRQKSK